MSKWVIETRDLKHLDHRQTQALRQRRKVRLSQLSEAVLQGVQVLNQTVAPQRHAGAGGTERTDLVTGCRERVHQPPLVLPAPLRGRDTRYLSFDAGDGNRCNCCHGSIVSFRAGSSHRAAIPRQYVAP